MENVRKMLEEKQYELENELKTKLSEQDALNKIINFVDKGLKNDDEDNYIILESILTALLSKTTGYSYSEIKNKTDFLCSMYKNSTESSISTIIVNLLKVLDDLTLKEVSTVFDEHKTALDISPKELKIEKITSIVANLNQLRVEVEKSNFPINEVLELAALGDYEEILSKLVFGNIFKNTMADLTSEKENAMVELSLLEIGIIKAEILMAYNYSKERIDDNKVSIRNMRKKISAYNEISTFLEKNKISQEISKIPNSIKKIDSTIQKEVLKSIYLHNKVYYENLSREYQELSEDGIRQRKILFKKYGINIDESNMLLEKNLRELESILEQVKLLNVKDSNQLLNIIMNLDKNKLESIVEEIKLGYITTDFIKDNTYLLFENQDYSKYENLINNISKMKDKKVSKTNISNSLKILLTDYNKISSSISTIEEYFPKKALKKASSYEFLQSNNLEEKMDILIELGLEENLYEDLSLLNYDKDKYLRLLVLKRLNICMDSVQEIKNILNNDNFIITDDKLDDYLLDMRNYADLEENTLTKKEFIEILESNNISSSNLSYSFDDVIVSKNKVKKELENADENLSIKEQFNILTKSKILDYNEYNKLEKLLFNRKNNKVLKK